MIYYGKLKNPQELLTSSFANDIETTEKDFSGNIHSVGFANADGGAVFFMDDKEDVEALKSLLQASLLNKNFQHEIYYHNVFFDLLYIVKKLFPYLNIKRANFFAPNVFDTLILARYLLTTGYQDHVDPKGRTAFGLKFLSEFHDIDDEQDSYDDVVGEVRIECVPKPLIASYCYDDCKNTFQLFSELKQIAVGQGTWDYFVKYHHPHAYKNVLHMGLNGIPVDLKSLNKRIDQFETVIEEIQDEVFEETRKIFDFNSPRDLAAIIFKNEALRDYEGKPLKKPFVTENESVSLDATTLKLLESRCRNSLLMTKIIFVIEAIHALGMMERLKESIVHTSEGPKVFPKQSASASSARLRCTNPPIHGFGKKMFNHTSLEFLEGRVDKSFVELSVRHFLAVADEFLVLSADGKSMDLVMMAELADIESWKEIFSWGSDNHFEILRVGNPNLFADVFKKWDGLEVGRIYKLGNEGDKYFLKLKEKTVDLTREEYQKLKMFRAIAKETNLAIPYMLGANQLAQKIAEATGEEVSEDYARGILKSYHKNFPEIRRYQDLIVNDLYLQGFVRASYLGHEFGIRLHSNGYHRMNTTQKAYDVYEFIIKEDGHHFYVRSREWVKHEKLVTEDYFDESKVIADLKYTFSPFGLFFNWIDEVIRLPDEIFEQKLIKASRNRYRMKNEDDLDEQSDYIHDSATRSCMVDRFLRQNSSNNPSSLECSVASKLTKFSYGFIPENLILFHRVPEGHGDSYFKAFRSLTSEIRKVFPTFIQSVTAACVARVLSRVRSELEEKDLKSYVFLSVHDSIDILVHKSEEKTLMNMTDPEKLKESFIPILWERDDDLKSHYS